MVDDDDDNDDDPTVDMDEWSSLTDTTVDAVTVREVEDTDEEMDDDDDVKDEGTADVDIVSFDSFVVSTGEDERNRSKIQNRLSLRFKLLIRTAEE